MILRVGAVPSTRPDPAELRLLAARAAAEAAAGLREVAGGADLVFETKSTSTDLVTEWDVRTERLLVDTILSARPGDGVAAEEGSTRASGTGVRWLLDPIDGTTNFVYGVPGWNVSVAAEVDGRVLAGAVADVVHDELFSAAEGLGATCNGRPIRCRPDPVLASALIATGFGYDADRRRRQAEVLARVLPEVRDIRRVGAAAVDLCWVACGRVDGYYERGLQPWDHAAGALVAREAGARVGGLDGDTVPDDGTIVAAAPGLFGPLRDLLRRAGAAQV
ncbi:MAG: inositol monophosphatase [Actinobacteria bacterium]|nr:inositol monophosphatase [Actinomycetota bacterium]